MNDERSYRALLSVPSFPEAVAAAQLGRIGGQMGSIAMVLFVLTRYHSPTLAGAVAFLSIFPGTIVAPLAGALLDRHGRKRLIIVDYACAALTLVLIGVLALVNLLPVPLLLLITVLSSLTAPLGNTGLRTLYPILVPRHLWERMNAVDSNGYVLASIVGPSLAGLIVALAGGEIAIIATGLTFAAGAIFLFRINDPETNTETTGNLLLDSWEGLLYVLRNETLRGLAAMISVANLANGMLYIVLPVLVLQRFHQGAATVGALFAVMGVAGLFTTTFFGRLNSEGRERQWLAWPQVALGIPVLAIALAPNLFVVAAALAISGLLIGPIDIALFTLRQRRTDPAWLGRAFAISMALNFSGVPIGAAIAGPMVSWSLNWTIYLAAILTVVAGCMPLLMLPAREDRAPAPAAGEAPPRPG
ncbi:MAG: MFS transporter [Candidatus Dormibacteraeota bacterium]|nr:MFS transporter [Candidatus Dormibacteraeota bacterium]